MAKRILGAEERMALNGFTWAVLFSLVTIATGMAWTWRVGLQSNQYAHRLGHAQDGLQDLKTLLSREARRP